MPLNVLACAGEECMQLELDDITLMFFDTLMAELNAAFLAHRSAYDYFEYFDEDEDPVSVRTDEELQTFLVESLRCTDQNPLQIQLSELHKPLEIKFTSESTHSLMRQQISFDESDDLIMASGVCPSSSSNMMEAEDAEHFDVAKQQQISPTIGPEDLRLVERLSDGQFGTVYKALDVKNDRLVAVKCIAVDGTNGTRQGLLNEIAILKKCAHPNIVTFYAAIFIENQLLICMELMDALSLDLYGQLPSLVLGAVSVAVVEGLANLWARSIMHRDIKPSNFLVNTAGEVKLADFGVSKQMAQSIAWSYVGTKVYMAPERIGGEVYNVASDVWSLGVALAEMALGRFPFNAVNDAASIESVLISSDRISALLEEPMLNTIGNQFTKLLAGCLAPNPKQRYGPEAIVSCHFLQSHRPMNQTIVCQFINQKRNTASIANK